MRKSRQRSPCVQTASQTPLGPATAAGFAPTSGPRPGRRPRCGSAPGRNRWAVPSGANSAPRTNGTPLPLHATGVVFPLPVPLRGPTPDFGHTSLSGGVDKLPAATRQQTRSCGTNSVWVEPASPGESAPTGASSESQFPQQCVQASGGLGLQGLLQPPRSHCGRGAAGPNPPAGTGHSPPLATIITCPVSKGDATRTQLPSPPSPPSRASS